MEKKDPFFRLKVVAGQLSLYRQYLLTSELTIVKLAIDDINRLITREDNTVMISYDRMIFRRSLRDLEKVSVMVRKRRLVPSLDVRYPNVGSGDRVDLRIRSSSRVHQGQNGGGFRHPEGHYQPRRYDKAKHLRRTKDKVPA